MRILAIETSCDETAVCVLEATGEISSFRARVLGNALYSQIATHKEYGGVFPMLAKREHQKNLVPIMQQALTQAKLLADTQKPSVGKATLDEIKILLTREEELFARLMPFFAQYERPAIDAIAVTHGPGLEPALWVGVNFAKALAHAWGLPVVPINHMEGHVLISMVSEQEGTYTLPAVEFPSLALLISGGHTEMILSREWFSYERVGETRDDAVGEAFDKIARLMGLPYPGGPEMSRLAKEAREKDIRSPFPLTRPMLKSGDLDFSFSGTKTAVRVGIERIGELTEEHKRGIAREFEDLAADVFVEKVRRAVEAHGIRTLVVGGGVAASAHIRDQLGKMAARESLTYFPCQPSRATDNALMIAVAGYFRATRGEYAAPESIVAQGTLSLAW